MCTHVGSQRDGNYIRERKEEKVGNSVRARWFSEWCWLGVVSRLTSQGGEVKGSKGRLAVDAKSRAENDGRCEKIAACDLSKSRAESDGRCQKCAASDLSKLVTLQIG